jgi:hypothetical protein
VTSFKDQYQQCFVKRGLILPRGAKQRISIRNYGGGILSVLSTIHSVNLKELKKSIKKTKINTVFQASV